MNSEQQSAHKPDFLEIYAQALPDGPEKMYVLGRLRDQLEWFGKKSTENKNVYRQRKIRIIFLSALIPVAVGYADSTYAFTLLSRIGLGITLGQVVKIAVALAGAFVAIWEAISMFMKYRELWFNYRTAAERLKQESWKYVTKIDAYQNEATRFLNLVVNVETILEKESSQWNELIRKEDEKEKAQAIRDEVTKILSEQNEQIKSQKEGKAAGAPAPKTTPTTTPTTTTTSGEGEQTTTTPPPTNAGTSTETPPPAETPLADTETHGEEESESHGEEEENERHGEEEEETPKG